MAIAVTFFKNSKRVNSTKLPAYNVGTFGTTIELKDYTNLFNPSLVLSRELFHDSNNNPVNPMEWNYCYIPDFNRYYYVRSWSWVLGRWECDLEIDALASFKTSIGNTTAYVLRSASNCDNRIIDTKYTTKSDVKTLTSVRSTIWETNLSSTSVNDGFYVLGIVNNDSGAIGATSYYAVNARGMRRFMAELYASPSWMNITDTSISNDLQKMLINPIQYINTCMWIPYSLLNSSSLTQVTTIPVGWWNITINSNDPFYKLTGASLKMTFYTYLDILVHPQATGNSNLNWVKNSPYSAYQLQFYPFGVFPIDSAKLMGYNRLNCRIDLDLVTGDGTLTVTRGIDNQDYSGDILYSVSSQVGIPISMSQMSVDLSRVNSASSLALSAGLALASDTAATSELVTNAKEVAESLIPDIPLQSTGLLQKWGLDAISGATFDPSSVGITTTVSRGSNKDTGSALASLLKSAGKVVANIGNAVIASSGTCKTTGTNGTLAQYTLDQILTLFYFEIVDIDPVMYGYPLCQKKKINTLSGFVLCANEGDLEVPATATERQVIAAAMKEGFFYE